MRVLFSAPAFLLFFLPLSVAGFYALGRWSRQWGFLWLIASSVFFYAWWNPPYVLLLIASTVMNYVISIVLLRVTNYRRTILTAGIAVDILALAYFKYTGFFLEATAALGWWDTAIPSIILPLGISFITFQKIAYLVDSYRKDLTDTSFVDFCLFVTFFPQLVAGPIVHQRDVMPQFKARTEIRPQSEFFSTGITMFLLGLSKKVLIADPLASFVEPVFHAAETATISFLEAWGSALAYTFQLYFDFSGYADMAIGAGLMFGILLPLNFDSPYKARSIIDFWRRWHMSLSRFLRDYIYIPLGGNRRGPSRHMVNLFLTMFIAGIWHGAGWTFVIWGALHGAYLVVNHLWRHVTGGKEVRGMFAIGSWILTFAAIVASWVIFRAETLSGATSMLQSMIGLHGIAMPGTAHLGSLALVLPRAPFKGDLEPLLVIGLGRWVKAALWMAMLLPVTLLLPNTQQYMGLHQTKDAPTPWLRWKPTASHAVLFALLAIITMSAVLLSEQREFLYFQF